MQNDNNLENNPEIIKPNAAEAEKRYTQWSSAMSNNVPEFNGEDSIPPESSSEPHNYDQGLADASAILNYGLDAPARKYGAEAVVRAIEESPSDSSDPIKDLYNRIGIDTAEEVKEVSNENNANISAKTELQESIGTPTTNYSPEGARQAISDMKGFIAEVKGADPSFENSREAAREAGKGVFDYAAETSNQQGLVGAFGALRDQRGQEMPKENIPEPEKPEISEPNPNESSSEDPNNPENPNSPEAKTPESVEPNPQNPVISPNPTIARETLNPDILKPNSPDIPKAA